MNMRRSIQRSLFGPLLAVLVLVLSAQPAAASPSVSPYVLTTRYTNAMYDDCKREGELCSWCPRGYSCAIVNDPSVVNLRRVFYFYHCRTYTVSDWRGFGSFVNNQRDGARTYLYGRQGNLLRSVPADSRMHFYDFEPVWFVKAC